MKIRVLIVCLWAVAAAVANAQESKRWLFGDTPDDECEVQRKESYECAIKYADLNKDDRVSIYEVIYFRNKVMQWWEKALVWAVRETPEKIMDRCAERPHKHHITRKSIETYTYDCLRHCRDWRLAKKMCDRMDAMDPEDVQEWKDAYPAWRKEQEEEKENSE